VGGILSSKFFLITQEGDKILMALVLTLYCYITKINCMISKNSKQNNIKTEVFGGAGGRSRVHFVYMLVIAFLLMIGSSISVYAQASPSATPNGTNNEYPDNRTNYNYLGLLGLLGLYGLHKSRVKQGTSGIVIDRRAA